MRAARQRTSGNGDPAARHDAGRSAADVDLDLLFAQIDGLRALGREQARRPDPDRVYDFSIRWGTYLSGRLARLEHYARHDGLTPAERDRYTLLLRALREVTPQARELGLTTPPSY